MSTTSVPARTPTPASQAAAKHMLWAMWGAASPWEAHLFDPWMVDKRVQSPDFNEAVSAFLEKRQPHFLPSVDAELNEAIPQWFCRFESSIPEVKVDGQ
jgi:hypothetical protein